ncbi:MAG: chemotaxis protein CheX [Arcobacter sp.]|uniref:chemotaxis protein CheX n=1 Tax=Arcobacter sp. TaxID=1872629 RepID=UPI003B00B1AD
MEFYQNILEKLSNRMIRYIRNDLNMSKITNDFVIKEVDLMNYKDITSLISLSGEKAGTIGLSVSSKFAKKMVKKFIFGEIDQSSLDELASENVSETLNIILGNILDEEEVKNINISTPHTLHNKVTITKKKNGRIFFSKLKYEEEEIILSYFI